MTRRPPGPRRADGGRASEERYWVYVVELARPGPVASVYVGSSALPPEERFRKHRAGGMATSRYVRRQGVRLRPDLYAHANRRPIRSRTAAREVEHQLRADLRRQGFRVYGACDERKDGCFF